MKKPPQQPHKRLSDSEWDFSKVKDEYLSICLYYEFARSSDHFIKQVEAWRSRYQNIMDAAERFLDCIGSFPPLDELYPEKADLSLAEPVSKPNLLPKLVKSKPKSNPLPKNAKHAVFRDAIKDYFDQTPPWSFDDRKAYDEFWNPNGIPLTDPLNFLYHFPLFPHRAWQALSEEEMKRAKIFFARDTLFPFPPTIEKLSNRQPLPKYSEPSPIAHPGGTPSWRWRLFMEQPALVEGDSFGVFPDSYVFEKDAKQLWAGGYCHEHVYFTLNWAKSNSEITKEFEKWLGGKKNDRRPHPEFSHGKATSKHEALKQLGAYRILKTGIKSKQACEEYQPYQSKDKADAENQFRRAAQKAQNLLNKWFPNSGF